MLKYFPKIPVQDLTHVGLDRAGPMSSVIPQAPENSLILVRVTTLEGGWKQISQNVLHYMCLSLYVFLTTCHHTPCYKLTDQNWHVTQCSHLNRKHLRTHKAAAPENSIQQGISCWMIVNQPSEHHVQRHWMLSTVGNGGVKANIARRQELRIKKRGKSWTDSHTRGMKRASANPRVVWPVTSWQVDVTEWETLCSWCLGDRTCAGSLAREGPQGSSLLCFFPQFRWGGPHLYSALVQEKKQLSLLPAAF